MGFLSHREAFGRSLQEYGGINKHIVVLDADTSSSTMSRIFAERYPERFINVGIAEPCLIDVSVGMALGGYIPFVNAFSALLSLRALEQIRTCIAYANMNVKIAAGYSGLSDFKDGPTHHSIMDIGIMRMLPGMTVIVPADEIEIKEWIPIIAEYEGPIYFRLSRAGSEVVHKTKPILEIGKGIVLREGDDVCIIAVGLMVSRCLQASELLAEKGVSVSVVEMPSIKPLDEELILDMASKTKAFVTAEEHSIIGGLGGAVAEVLASKHPIPLERIGIKDTFARTAPDPDSLLDAYGMGVDEIIMACNSVLERKK